MDNTKTIDFIKSVLDVMPPSWLELTTHRLDIYNEGQAKVEFLSGFDQLSQNFDLDTEGLRAKLAELPTAYDYIRLGHPLSCVLEWALAKSTKLDPLSVISFSSEVMPILAILRKNLLENINTQIVYKNEMPECFNESVLKNIYGYKFELIKIKNDEDIKSFEGSIISINNFKESWNAQINSHIDFTIYFDSKLGSIAAVHSEKNKAYISEIQHVRRRESIAMTPQDSLIVLNQFIHESAPVNTDDQLDLEKTLHVIKEITNTSINAALGSCGLSVQYAIMMGLIHHAKDKYEAREIKFIVPPNCYGGTNDQARRVAACLKNVEVVDLPVDRGQDMAFSLETILSEVALNDGVAFIIAEIPTNPRVEVPDLVKLEAALNKKRKTQSGADAISPVFILDQTFCPNVKFLGEGDYLSTVKTISYVSGSKFPSGGLCTAGYCTANDRAADLMSYVQNHLKLCGNGATAFQIKTLALEMPTMVKRIAHAYQNTREFVDFIEQTLPEAKINFVPKSLAAEGFTPSVFSLDLPTKGESAGDRESFKRDLNLKLITLMINKIPHESKHCVSYGQLKGCYWTIPATSTQGTTKEGDKDYIVRVSIAPSIDLELHKKVFAEFCQEYF